MKDIKFKVWHKSKRKWLTDLLFGIDMKGVHDFSHDSSIRYNYTEDVEIIQFTGLYDCKGVEIFEGDKIVRRYAKSDKVFMSGVIKHGKKNIGSNGFEYDNTIHGFYPDTNDSDIEYLYGKFVDGEVEVVGNIYEDNKGE